MQSPDIVNVLPGSTERAIKAEVLGEVADVLITAVQMAELYGVDAVIEATTDLKETEACHYLRHWAVDVGVPISNEGGAE